MDLFHRQILLQQGSDVILEPDNKYQTNRILKSINVFGVHCIVHSPN